MSNLRGTRIRCPDGTLHGPIELGAAFTFFYKDSSLAFCDVILSSILCEMTEAEAVSIILHELSHTFDYFTEREAEAQRPEHEAEQRCFARVEEWATRSELDPKLIEQIEDFSIDASMFDSLFRLAKKTLSGNS